MQRGPRADLGALAGQLDLAPTRIGGIDEGAGNLMRDEHGSALETLPAAFDHSRA
jgi:hypothetical protein